MKDVFDYGTCSEDLVEKYLDVLWCDLGEELKDKIYKEIELRLRSENKRIPSKSVIVKRVKGFYNSRRTQLLTRNDPKKNKLRKLDVKANRLTYVSRYIAPFAHDNY